MTVSNRNLRTLEKKQISTKRHYFIIKLNEEVDTGTMYGSSRFHSFLIVAFLVYYT